MGLDAGETSDNARRRDRGHLIEQEEWGEKTPSGRMLAIREKMREPEANDARKRNRVAKDQVRESRRS